MAYSKRKTTVDSVLFSRGMALVILLVIVFVGFGVVSIAEKSIDASRQRKIAEAQEADLQQKADGMSKQIASLNTDEGKEAALRDEFPVVKPGEHVIVITDPSTDATSDVPVDQAPSSSGGFWSFLKNLFK